MRFFSTCVVRHSRTVGTRGNRGSTYIVIGSTEDRAICSNCYARNRDIFLGNQLVGAVVLGQIPDAYTAAAVAADNLALIGVNHDIIDSAAVVVATLDSAATRLPDLDSTVLGARNHPLALAVECDARDIASMALKCQQGVGVGRLDIKEFHGMVAGGRKEAFVG